MAVSVQQIKDLAEAIADKAEEVDQAFNNIAQGEKFLEEKQRELRILAIDFNKLATQISQPTDGTNG